MNITATLQARKEEIQALLVSASADVEAAYKMHQEALAVQNTLLDERGLIDKLLAISGPVPAPNVGQTTTVEIPEPPTHTVSFDMALGMLSRQRQGAMNRLAILQLLKKQPGMRTAALAASTRIEVGAVAGLIQRLVGAGMVCNRLVPVTPGDRRGYEWILTEKGLQFLQKYFH